MDQGRYLKLIHSDARARYVNQRYLIVPIKPANGVFHSKLNLLVRNDGASLLCGSNNLTQAGYTQNLEIFSYIEIPADVRSPAYDGLLKSATAFFRGCLELASGPGKRLAKEFLSDLNEQYPWLMKGPDSGELKILHTLSHPLLPAIKAELGSATPERMLVVSPFFDQDLRLLNEVRELWPNCRIDLVTQEQTGNLPAKKLKQFKSGVRLYRLLAPKSRRLHAKIVAVIAGETAVCCSGSANFTTAAFSGRNIEACLLMRIPEKSVIALFDDDLSIEPIKPDSFDTGSEREPEEEIQKAEPICLHSAAIGTDNRLSLQYTVDNPAGLIHLKVALKAFGEDNPRKMMEIPPNPAWFEGIKLPGDSTTDFQGAIQCFLEGRLTTNEVVRSAPAWIIQVASLTRARADGGLGETDRERIIRETGKGTTEYLDALAAKKGAEAVIQFLLSLNIRFHADLAFHQNNYDFRIAPHDPTRADVAPEWTRIGGITLESAIFDFVDRHHCNVLRRHARSGNINGIANFMDVFVECNKLLFVYYRRKVVRPLFALEYILQSASLLANNSDLETKEIGFIDRIKSELPNESERINEVFRKSHVSEHLCMALLMAQYIRHEKEPHKRPSSFLHDHAMSIGEYLQDVRPTPESLAASFLSYGFISNQEKEVWIAEAMSEPFNHT